MLNPEVDISFDTDQTITKKSKKQQLVKHKRKNWKKTDLGDVDQGIADYHQQKLTGGLKVDKKDDELFFINKTKLPLNEAGEAEPASKRPKRITLEEKMNNLNCYKNLKPDPNSLPAHIVRSITKPDRDSKRQAKANEFESKKMQRILSTKSRQSSYCAKLAGELRDQEDNGDNFEMKKRRRSKVLTPGFKEGFAEKKLNVHLDNEFEKDIWSNSLATDGSDLPVVTHTNEHYLRGLKKIPFRKARNPLYKESLIAKIEAPHPGHSYNPDFDDHQALLLKAHEVELKKLKEEQKFLRRLALNARKMSWQELEKRWMEEMSVRDLFEAKPAELEEESEEEADKGKAADSTVSNRELRRREKAVHIGRKADTRAKREKKKMLEKIKLRQKEHEKHIKIQEHEIFRLRTLKKEVEVNMKKVDDNTERRKEEEANKVAYGQKRLGKLKYEEPELELKLSEEITGNLRTLKAEGNIMRDRYKSLQKRNMIEPRDKSTGLKDKYSKKKFQKRNAYEVTNYIK